MEKRKEKGMEKDRVRYESDRERGSLAAGRKVRYEGREDGRKEAKVDQEVRKGGRKGKRKEGKEGDVEVKEREGGFLGRKAKAEREERKEGSKQGSKRGREEKVDIRKRGWSPGRKIMNRRMQGRN